MLLFFCTTLSHMARINFSFSPDENKVLTNKIVESVSSLNLSFDTSVIRGMLYVYFVDTYCI